ncbi:MAG: ABC transporter substrate-binding protein [Cellulosilyticaceae bacterium]
MFKKTKKLMALGLAATTMLVGCANTSDTPSNSDASDASPAKKESPTVIRFGSHVANGYNPNYKDPITGEYDMDEEEREVYLGAMQKVKDELNVEIEWVQYPGDPTEVLLQSVMAGDPIADVVHLYTNSQGIILGQNVLQPLDDYVALLGENAPPKLYGKNYFMEVGGNFDTPLSPLYYNISYIEQVDALKENGRTVYPTDLYLQGKWTWSVFEDYLAKIDAHFANSQAPERPERRIEAYRTDYTETLIQAMHSAGGSIYGPDGLGLESQGTKDAVAYVQRLVNKKILTCELREGTSNRPYNAQGEPFEKGESVFTNIESWRVGGVASKAAERGQSIGYIPFPRPDSMAFDDPNYRQVRTGGESWGILRGTDPELIPLAIQSYQVFISERRRLEAIVEGREEGEREIDITMDLFHPEIGDDLGTIYLESTGRTYVNELSNMTGIYWDFMGIAGDSIYGIGGSPNYDVAIESKKSLITERMDSVENLLNTTEVKDNIPPAFTAVEGTSPYVFPKGTDPNTVDWNAMFTINDNVDGALDAANATFDTSATDFNTVGTYSKGVVGTIKDALDNEGKVNLNITIYDAANQVAPTLTIKPEVVPIAKDKDSSEINWSGDYVDTATDADGLDLKSLITADLSELDTANSGTYNVPLTTTDYAGNTTTVVLEVVVE